MWKSLSDSIEIVHLNGTKDTDVESGIIDMTWEDLVEAFSTHDERKDKDGPCFIPACFKPKEEWVKVPTYSPTGEQLEGNFRKERNVDKITVIVLDLDKEGDLERAEELYGEFERFYVSTHSYTRETPYKFRYFIKLAEPIPAAEWRTAFFNLTKPIGADPSCQDLARFYFYPSISPDANIEPVFKPKPGRAMTKADIAAIGKDYVQGLSEDEKKAFERQASSGSVPQGKRHFSGRVLHHYEAVGSKLDFSYEALCKRHQDYIDDLLSRGHRHDFRMRVCSREVYKFGDKVSWLAVIQFMYRISQTHSNKPFTEGGARKDIPELITSSYGKNMPELHEKDPEFIRGLAKMLPEIIQTAHDNCVTQRWRFPKAVDAEVVEAPGIKALPKGSFSEKPDLDSMREEYKSDVKGLIAKGDPVSFASNVLERAYSNSETKPNIRALGQFVSYCLKGYYERCVKSANPDSEVIKAIDSIGNNKEKLLNNVDMDKESVELTRKQAMACLKLSKEQVLGKSDWMFSLKRPDKENEKA